MDTKPFYASKTFWVNLLTFVAGLAGYLAQDDWVKQNPHIVAGLAGAVGLLNIALRFVTKGPISLF